MTRGVIGRGLRLASLLLLIAPSWSATREPTDARARLRVRVTDEHGESLLARVRVAPAMWTERVRLGFAADVNARSVDGETEFTLVAGRYHVTVSRGPEWSLAEQSVVLRAGEVQQRAVTLLHEVQLPGFRPADLHVHTARSDDAHAHGGVTVDQLSAEGIELAAVTDHNQIGALGPGVESVAGAEITTWAPEVGHFNAFPLQRLPQWRHTNPRQLFAEIARDPNVFVQVNHPRLDDHIAYFTLGGFDGKGFARDDFNLNVDGIEVWNGYDIARIEQVEGLLREWRGIVARGHKLTATGGSDCHGMDGHHPGYPRTYVRADHAKALAPALKAGHAFVTNGPLLTIAVAGRGPGETVDVGGDTQEIHVSVLAPSWMQVEQVEIWVDERLAWTQSLSREPRQALRFSARAVLDVTRARSVHAVVRGGSGLDRLLGRGGVMPFAFTNPVYLTHGEVTHAAR